MNGMELMMVENPEMWVDNPPKKRKRRNPSGGDTGGAALGILALAYGAWAISKKSWKPWEQTTPIIGSLQRRLGRPSGEIVLLEKYNPRPIRQESSVSSGDYSAAAMGEVDVAADSATQADPRMSNLMPAPEAQPTFPSSSYEKIAFIMP